VVFVSLQTYFFGHEQADPFQIHAKARHQLLGANFRASEA
jgi:hypothetical protein